MKIAQIAPPWIPIPPDNYGGTENVLYHLVEELVAQGHEVTLFAPGDAQTSAQLVSFFPQALCKEQVPWYMHMKAYYHLHKTMQYIREQDFDIVHGHLSSTGDMYLFPLLASLQVPHLITAHSTFPFDKLPGDWQGDADTYFMEWAPKIPIVTISKSARSQIEFPLSIIDTVYHGVPMKQFTPRRPQGEPFLVWIGRFVAEKGAHLAIEAAKRTHLPLRLAGIKDESSPRSLAYFQRKIEPHLDGELIRYVGTVSHEQKIELLSQASAFLNPIEWEEPFGMVVLEAMAVGCPVIAFARGAMPEIIEHGKTGFLVHNLDEMVEYIPRIATLQRTRIRRHVQRHFSAEVMVRRYLAIYKQLIRQAQQEVEQEQTVEIAAQTLPVSSREQSSARLSSSPTQTSRASTQ
ncbi:MAG TPA: glycosyltransferase family 4 protein [Ktedonobacteraceae bacterium]|jgi:glycosyltransferase involved in cell wall biosynthesis